MNKKGLEANPITTVTIDEIIAQLQAVKSQMKRDKIDYLPVYSSIDDEGNGYTPVIFLPSVHYVGKRELSHYIDGLNLGDARQDMIDNGYSSCDIQPVLILN